MDLKKIISTTDRYNFHSHTQFCDGRATMDEMATAACDAGFCHWGFSPHSPINIPSTCNMPITAVDTYLDEVDRLRQKHSGTMSIYASMEIDYLSPQWGPAIDLFQNYPLDYRIGSVHFVPTRNGEMVDCDGNFERFSRNMHTKFTGDIRYVVETFYTQSLKMIELGGFDIIGHMDKITHNASQYCPGIEEEQWYLSLVGQLADSIADKNLITEINTKALPQHGRIFPSVAIIERLIKRGVTIAVNSDAHYPDKINAGRQEAFSILSHLTH